MWLFGKNEDGWFMAENGKYSYAVEKPALFFSYHPDMGGIRGTLHKFGEASRVKADFEETFQNYLKHGLEDIASELVYMDFEDNFDVEELNKCIEITGYVALLYERGISHECERNGEGLDRKGTTV